MFLTLKTMFKWLCYAIYKICVKYIKNICGKFISQFLHQRISKNISCNSFIKKNLKLIAKKKCFRPLKQCLSEHVMQFIKFISNTLKIFVSNLFHRFHVKESKKPYRISSLCAGQVRMSITSACDRALNTCTQHTKACVNDSNSFFYYYCSMY